MNREYQIKEISLSKVEFASQNLDNIRQKLPSEYYDYLDVFDRFQANHLFFYRTCDNKIELLVSLVSSQSQIYRISPYKLMKVKEYLNKNLSKSFFTLSKALYSLPVLFALKANGDLKFCVDYQKLNAIIKSDWYLLPLIEKVIGKIIGWKYLTRLDIIAEFNKPSIDTDD